MRRAACLLAFVVVGAPAAAQTAARSNVFGDPFVAVTHGLAGCPAPAGPLLTRAQATEQAHGRAQRGVSCYLAGRCRLANSYLYDREIVPRVQIAVTADGRFAGTSVWATGQRRWVWLQGCVADAGQAADLVALVRRLDDVEGVVDELMVGTTAKPPYETAR